MLFLIPAAIAAAKALGAVIVVTTGTKAAAVLGAAALTGGALVGTGVALNKAGHRKGQAEGKAS